MDSKICPICKQEFTPSKYRPKQQVCSRENCQYLRQLDNMKAWRVKNPAYFKRRITTSMTGVTNRYLVKGMMLSKVEYQKAYRRAHKLHHREYMRKYMTERRRKKLENTENSLFINRKKEVIKDDGCKN